ncbi:MAG: sulfatase-like hydrolase/transferase [Candidatus Eremiobacteraeota bacterium]|nr:sulfatase-like hydrolase/transferase [Candidatus Eremiobacteraeota bacterium]MBV8364909.1 sulfatase-like hydrolase/transferase [Candidatus Eremiobacteraeota bacterium]
MKRGIVVALVVLALAGLAYGAEQWNGIIKTDMASLITTRDVGQSTVIPEPTPTYGGNIQRNAYDSTAWWEPQIAPHKGAPNILLVLIDDEGFGAPSTFGGLIPMPNSDALAKQGLRYTNFHTTSLCSPTRAALITGRNHGAVGFEMIAELATGFPGYKGSFGKESSTVARLLQANGYATAWFGKDHNVPLWEATDAGPKTNWPMFQGFDYFYGFLGGDMDQWHPTVYENFNQIFPDVGHPGYNLNVDIADKAIAWLNRVNDLKPNQPVFLYYCPGATHAPHQPTPDWIAKMKGKFNMGWNQYRDFVFKRQQEMGIIPKAAKLTPWPDQAHADVYGGMTLPTWDSLNATDKAAYEHEMEVYAAYLAQTDYEVGRVIEAFKKTGRYNNTMIIWIHGDNGASAEGSLNGTPSEVMTFNGVFLTPAQYGPRFLSHWGDEYTDPHYPVSWAWALDTPFKWTKQIASFFGGTKNGAIISWPGHINDPGGIRQQFHHVIDIAPTILEAAGITPPDEVDGVKQTPLEGVSMTYTFDKANANAPSTHHTQYFEMFGAAALYNDGWIAATQPHTIPWLVFSNKPIQDVWGAEKWSLYHVTADDDWTEYNDVKAKYPDKLKELQDLFVTEAQKNNVFPLNNLPFTFDARPSLIAGRTTVTYHPGIIALNQADTPNVLNNDYSIEGDITIPAGGANGVIVADGGRFGGYSLFLQNGQPHFTYNLIDTSPTPYRWVGASKLSAGQHKLTFSFVYDGGGFGKGGVGTLSVDGKAVDTHRVPATVPSTLPWFEGLDIGGDYSTPVDPSYTVPNKFTGSISQVVYHTGPLKISQAQWPEYYQRLFAAAMGIQ